MDDLRDPGEIGQTPSVFRAYNYSQALTSVAVLAKPLLKLGMDR